MFKVHRNLYDAQQNGGEKKEQTHESNAEEVEEKGKPVEQTDSGRTGEPASADEEKPKSKRKKGKKKKV